MALHVALCWFTVALFLPSSLPFVTVCVPQTLQQAPCFISLPKSSSILSQLLFTHSWPFISISHLAIVLSLISLSFLLKSSLFLHTTQMPSEAVWTAEEKLSPRPQFLSLVLENHYQSFKARPYFYVPNPNDLLCETQFFLAWVDFHTCDEKGRFLVNNVVINNICM